MKNDIIAVVGMTGAGKSIVADALVQRGYQFLRFGQITIDLVKERGLEPTEENERPIREEVRRQHGMGAYAILNIPKIDALLEEGPIVIDGLYSWTEYKILKDRYGSQLRILAVYAPPEARYQRLVARTTHKDDIDIRARPASRAQAQSRDYAEIENIEKSGPIAMAEGTLINTGSVPELLEQLNRFMAQKPND